MLLGLKEPGSRSEKADVRPDIANLKLKKADLSLERVGLRLGRSED